MRRDEGSASPKQILNLIRNNVRAAVLPISAIWQNKPSCYLPVYYKNTVSANAVKHAKQMEVQRTRSQHASTITF